MIIHSGLDFSQTGFFKQLLLEVIRRCCCYAAKKPIKKLDQTLPNMNAGMSKMTLEGVLEPPGDMNKKLALAGKLLVEGETHCASLIIKTAILDY